jgi:hypothetical protein
MHLWMERIETGGRRRMARAGQLGRPLGCDLPIKPADNEVRAIPGLDHRACTGAARSDHATMWPRHRPACRRAVADAAPDGPCLVGPIEMSSKRARRRAAAFATGPDQSRSSMRLPRSTFRHIRRYPPTASSSPEQCRFAGASQRPVSQRRGSRSDADPGGRWPATRHRQPARSCCTCAPAMLAKPRF